MGQMMLMINPSPDAGQIWMSTAKTNKWSRQADRLAWILFGIIAVPFDPVMFLAPVLLSSSRVYFSTPRSKWMQLPVADL